MRKFLGLIFPFLAINMQAYSQLDMNMPVNYIPRIGVSNHRTSYKCSANKVEKQRTRNKIARKSRKINW
jgi:hypothetical protein